MIRARVGIVLLLMLIIILLTGCNKNNQIAINNDSGQRTNMRGGESIGFNVVFDMLNNSELFNIYTDEAFVGLSDNIIKECMDNDKQKLPNLIYNGDIFPQSLISMMGNALYNNNYDDVMKKLVMSNYRIDKNELLNSYKNIYEDISAYDNFTDIYKIELSASSEYFVVVNKGGSLGNYHVIIINYENGKKNIIKQFEIPNYSNGDVIKYENSYYFVYVQQNFNFRFRDSIEIFKLENNDVKSLRISFVPESYVWKNVYNKQESDAELSEYLSEIQDDLVNGNYIDCGKLAYSSEGAYYVGNENLDLYRGDEEVVENIENVKYKIDFGNIGHPVYFSKYLIEPSSVHMTMHLKGQFYLYDSQSKTYKELSNLSLEKIYRPDKDRQLIQMWFKVINNKVYMLRVFHLMDYCYILNVSLIENGEITEVRNDIFIPQKSFTLLEGKQFHSF